SPLLIELPDEFVAFVFRQRIKKVLDSPKIVFGQEVSEGFLEDELWGIDLFSKSSPCLVLNAQDIPEASLNFLSSQRERIDWTAKPFVLMATKKNRSLAKLIRETRTGAHHVLTLPGFWEMNALLAFFASHFDLTLEGRARAFVMEFVQGDSRHYFEALGLLKTEYPQKRPLTLEEVGRVLNPTRLDRFALARALGERRPENFYGPLLRQEWSFEDLRSLFSFLQSHVVKLMDPSYIKPGGRVSRYDRQIQDHGRGWKREELAALLEELARWEAACKSRDTGLRNRMRLSYLKRTC
ncbi:MAG: hypothetical protein OXB88_02190, partial [Bacteriovoracales bacterium]|nr:hypothetical protein [Bacteriovoracales bacterium]